MSAHGYILRSVPENRAVLERPPTRLQYWFSEALEPNFSTIVLRDQTGAVLAEGAVDADNPSLMALRVPAGLPDGAYVVDLRPAFASDGHVVAESRVFFVGEEVGGVSGSSGGYEVLPLEVAWRVLLMAATLLLFGAFVVYSYVLVPAWGSDEFRAGLLPPRVMRRLNVIVIGAIGAAFAANILALLQQSMVFFNTGLTEVITQNLWSLVRIGSRFGDVWNIRMLLLLAVALLHGGMLYYRDRFPQFIRPFWNANVWMLALIVGSFSITAHAAGSLLWPWVAVFVDWLHALAVGAWVGGLAALVLVLPVALRPYEEDTRRQALLAVLRRFSRLALGALVLVIATGIYSASNWLYAPAELTETAWGGALTVKMLLVVGLMLLGLLHHVSSNPQRFHQWSVRLERVSQLFLTLRLEVVVALVVLVAVAALAATPVPEPEFLGESLTAPDAIQIVGDYDIRMIISPGGPGVNTYDTVLERDGQPVTMADVKVRLINPSRDWRSPWYAAESADSGIYVTAGGDISSEGNWLAVYDITPVEGETIRAVFDWQISSDAAIIESRDPNLLNIAALVAMIVVCLWLLYPLLLRLYHWLDWRPASIAAGGSAILATLVFIGLAVVMARQSELTYAEAVNPPPSIVNTVLPDSQSLARGQDLYTASCPNWQESRRDWALLTERMDRMRDENLYTIVEAGWQDLAPCAAVLEAHQRWDVVNYLRTLSE